MVDRMGAGQRRERDAAGDRKRSATNRLNRHLRTSWRSRRTVWVAIASRPASERFTARNNGALVLRTRAKSSHASARSTASSSATTCSRAMSFRSSRSERLVGAYQAEALPLQELLMRRGQLASGFSRHHARLIPPKRGACGVLVHSVTEHASGTRAVAAPRTSSGHQPCVTARAVGYVH
jgi:hypothetical protein